MSRIILPPEPATPTTASATDRDPFLAVGGSPPSSIHLAGPSRSPPRTRMNPPPSPTGSGGLFVSRVPSGDTAALAAGSRRSSGSRPSTPGDGASMLLYRMSDFNPPAAPFARQGHLSVASRDSMMSVSDDSKYPGAHVSGMVPYAFDPGESETGPEDDDDLHDWHTADKQGFVWSVRGMLNVAMLATLLCSLLALFAGYPLVTYLQRRGGHVFAAASSPGFKPVVKPFAMPGLVDLATPTAALTRTGNDGEAYTLVFSDEFETPGRTFYPGDDPFWTAMDLWYWSTNDLEYYTPGAVTTADGALVITMQNTSASPWAGFNYTSGMLQSWNQFCFTGGYIEVALILPGPDSNTRGYWPGAWTMGNLGRPGYGATTDGTWPYTYDSCDVGTFPNQTLPDLSGPAAALNSTSSKAKYDYRLSWLPGQRLSACTCKNEDHPGPSVAKGRGAPEIDIIEAERNKDATYFGGFGQVVSQSAQFAPFTHDYLSANDTADKFDIYDSNLTWPNSYRGSAVQQAVSSLTRTPDDMYQGQPNNGTFRSFGFEYYANTKARTDGFVTWYADAKPSYRMGAAAVGPDTGDGGSGVGQRLVPEEPMSIILNLGLSHNWQTIDPTSMLMPGVMKVDYVRVYQRTAGLSPDGLSCSPPDYPTAEYIANHADAYANPNLTTWSKQGPVGGTAGYPWPKNSAYDGGC